MHLQITALDMRYSFETKTTQNILKAVLPTGRQLEFEVSDEEVEALMRDTADSPPIPQHEPATSIENPSPPELRLIRWMELPDHVLAPFLKAELLALNVSDELTTEELISVLHNVTAEKKEEIKEQRSQLGVVERGVPLPSQPRSRRVESDERGNPVVQQRQVVTDDDIDEDTGARSI